MFFIFNNFLAHYILVKPNIVNVLIKGIKIVEKVKNIDNRIELYIAESHILHISNIVIEIA